MRILPDGLWPVMLTPFNDQNEIDTQGLRELTDLYINAGASGLFANCLSSEMFQLSEEERLTITKIVIEQSAGRVPVIATGTFGNNSQKHISFIKRINDLGTTAVIINSNQLVNQNESDELLIKNMEILVKQTNDIPLGVYECPLPYRRLLSSEVMRWLTVTDRFLYLKDTSCDISIINQKLEIVKSSSLKLYNAHFPSSLQSLKIGAAGISTIGANYFPEIYNYLVNNFNSKEIEQKIVKTNSLLTSIDPHLHEFYPYSAKFFLQLRGMPISTHTRAPYKNPVSEDLLKFKELLIEFEFLVNEIEIPVVL